MLASSTIACEVLSGDFETTPITTKTACQIGNNGCSTRGAFCQFDAMIFMLNTNNVAAMFSLNMQCIIIYDMNTKNISCEPCKRKIKIINLICSKNVCPTIIHPCHISLFSYTNFGRLKANLSTCQTYFFIKILN